MAVTCVRDSRLRLRPLMADDGERLCRLFHRLSPESVYRRFLSPMPTPRADVLARLLDVDHRDREAIAALEGDEIVAVARYIRAAGADVAEVAVTVADDWQHRGLGRLLMRRLGRLARRRGIRAFTGTIAGENRAALLLVRSTAPGVRARWATGEIEFEIPLLR
ncbi:MAG TPA: GNAT family N-acetyltransferase [Candidatus Dormibacteraeota bacterium]|jgi:GNAT superfamily N-acetyltransferase